MKWGNFGRRLDAHAFATRFVKTVVGRAPDVEVRLSGPLQYQSNPGALDEILKRWVDGLIAGLERAPTIDAMNIVPIVKGRYWIERQRADHLEQFGAEAPFDLYWEPYNTCLIVA